MASKGNKKDAKLVPATVMNRRARYDYEFVSTYEAGMVLVGAEVKNVFAGKVNMSDAYCKVENREIWLVNLDIEPYRNATSAVPERRRDRKLLLHRREIDVISRRSFEKGLAIIPYKIYFKNGKAKIEIALARGKKQYDKRRAIREKDQIREMKKDGLI